MFDVNKIETRSSPLAGGRFFCFFFVKKEIFFIRMKSSLRNVDRIPRSDTRADLFRLSSGSVIPGLDAVMDVASDAKH